MLRQTLRWGYTDSSGSAVRTLFRTTITAAMLASRSKDQPVGDFTAELHSMVHSVDCTRLQTLLTLYRRLVC